jgi:Oxidoreductase NAD-binding domain
MRPLVIVMGARTQADVYALDAIDQIRRSWSGRFHFEAILSAEPEGSNWQGKRGLVNDHLPALLGERQVPRPGQHPGLALTQTSSHSRRTYLSARSSSGVPWKTTSPWPIT